MSFAYSAPEEDYHSLSSFGASTSSISRDYDIWMVTDPGSITNRRNRVLQGMGLTDKGVVRIRAQTF